MPSWTRAPPESFTKMKGLPVFMESFIISVILAQCTSPAAPPATEVLAGKVHQPAIDCGATCDHTVRWQLFVCHTEVSGAMLGEEADFLKAIAINQLVDALARGQLTRFMLLLNALFAAAFPELRSFLPEFGDALLHGRACRLHR